MSDAPDIPLLSDRYEAHIRACHAGSRWTPVITFGRMMLYDIRTLKRENARLRARLAAQDDEDDWARDVVYIR